VLVKYPTKYDECLNTVLSQECIRYNSLITVMLSTLALSIKALKGLVVMSPELDSVCDAIFNNQVRMVPRVRESPPYPHCVRETCGIHPVPGLFAVEVSAHERT
jgi:dynein heavy chain